MSNWYDTDTVTACIANSPEDLCCVFPESNHVNIVLGPIVFVTVLEDKGYIILKV